MILRGITMKLNIINKKSKDHSRKISILIVLICTVLVLGNLNIANAAIKYESSEDQIKKTYRTDYEPFIFNKLFGIGNFKYYFDFKKISAQLEDNAKNYNHEKFPYQKLVKEIIDGNKRVDIGSNFINDVIKNNNRLDYYDLYIKLAKEKGYIVTDYYDYLMNYKNTDKKVLILRHDIDIANEGTKYMMEIEKKNNVKATYYFRWSSFDNPLIQELHKEGFEVGLHYETIAEYCRRNNKYTINAEDINICRGLLKEEITKFKKMTGIDIKTISSHGNPINKEIGIPNYGLLLGQKYSDFGIVDETYDENILRKYVKSYICDSELTKNDGFSYHTNVVDSILSGDKVIEFLSHPNHWNIDKYKRAKFFIEVKNGVKFK